MAGMWPSASSLGQDAADARGAPAPVVLIANPENRRAAMFLAAVGRLGLPPPRVIAYQTLLAAEADVGALLSAQGPAVIRIESPGENAAVERALVDRGARALAPPEIPSAYRPGEPIEHGRIYCPRLWYCGFCAFLRACVVGSAARPVPVRWMNHPAEIEVLFDKGACRRRLEDGGVPVPAGLGTVGGYDDLLDRLRAAGRSAVFLKLLHGSSASGVVALRIGKGPLVCAVTSVEMVRTQGEIRLYNALRLRRYEREPDVAVLVDALAPHGLHVEAWVPKAGWGGASFDLRIVTIAGRPCHVVMRTSRGPMTNLHLGNRRGDLDALRRHVPDACWEAALESCARTAGLFPRCLCLGIDLAFEPGWRRHAVLEVNAFGDLLPGVTHEGRDTYEAEAAAMSGRQWPGAASA